MASKNHLQKKHWLKVMMTRLLVLCLVVVVGLGAWLSYFYVNNVHPYKSIIQTKLIQAHKAHQHLPQHVTDMLAVEFACLPHAQATDCQLIETKNLRVAKLIAEPIQAKNLKRQVILMMLSYTLVAALTDSEKNTLIATFSYMGLHQKTGFSAFSQAYFNKPLSALTLTESAQLIALLKAPSQYLHNKHKWQQRTDYLLQTHKAVALNKVAYN